MNYYEEEQDERRTEHLHICISKAEKKAIQEAAEWLGTSTSDYCRQAIEDSNYHLANIKTIYERDYLRDVVKEKGGIGHE